MNGWKADKFRERVSRLASLVQVHAPEYIVATEVLMVHEAAWASMGDDMGRAMSNRTTETLSGACGICSDCGKPMPNEVHHCEKCLGSEFDEGEEP